MTELPSTRIVRAADRGPLSLVVIGEQHLATHPLPASGQITLGRAPTCDVHIDERSISRCHAILRIGDAGITIEDLASANGTRVAGQSIDPHRPRTIRQGEIVELGQISIMIQRRSASAPAPRRLWTHGYFEGRLEDECARADETGATFSIIFIHCHDRPPVDAMHAALAEVLRTTDVAGEYGAGEYEILLADTPPDRADARAAALVEQLAARDVRARAGTASFPRDGRTPDALLAAATTSARPHAPVTPGGIVVEDPAMVQLRRVIERVAAGTLSVLLLGETGVGKEVLAEHVHRRSPRRDRPFLRLNCAAMTETLLESELFGHEKGAFTGAVATKPGLLETASGGTVFLDEIGEISPAIQVKLLRVLEERKVMRVGGLKPIPIDVRFVAATNRDLEEEIARGRFRQDLYYRLAGITLVIPPLRERQAEILPLARSFVAAVSAHTGRAPQLDAQAIELLHNYAWPGNIRELRNVVERAVLLSTNGTIRPEHLPLDKMRATFAQAPGPLPATRDVDTPRPSPSPAATDEDREVALAALYPGDPERDRIIATLELCRGNQTKAARVLGMSRRTLIYRLERYGLPRPRKR